MSWLPTEDPECTERAAEPAVELVIEGRPRDLGGIPVLRVLPSAKRRLVGPFIFLDHMGPVSFASGGGIDVPPHPHIGLETVTYLFEGSILHRDSLGSVQLIEPGAVNWMTAGRGIVHSERTAPERRESAHRLDGIQLWVALPESCEEMPPRFEHHPEATLPALEWEGARARVLAGRAFGAESPVEVQSALLYVDLELRRGGRARVPDAHAERAAYVARGSVGCRGERFGPGTLVVFTPGERVELLAAEDARVMLLGGAPLGPRFIRWNFVSTREERLLEASRDWRRGRFPGVPGDEGPGAVEPSR